jgi:SAM-dependent methyltransferase
MVTAMLSELVGRYGQVVGVDASAQQLTRARARLGTTTNVCFVEANASETGLLPLSFDLVYCRFLLIHLPDPEKALREMWNLLCPGGLLVCEDGDLTTAGSEPPTALRAFADLWGRLAPSRGVDYTLGRRLLPMVMAAGFTAPEVTFNQPVRVRGEGKRLLELSVAEAGAAFMDAGLITAEDLDFTLAKMRLATADESVLAVMPRMTQVWARKPASTP